MTLDLTNETIWDFRFGNLGIWDFRFGNWELERKLKVAFFNWC